MSTRYRVLPDGDAGVKALGRDGHTNEFVVNQYRHCKTILSLGASSRLLEKAGITPMLGSGASDPGLIVLDDGEEAGRVFMDALARHRHYERETDPPVV